MPSAPMVIFRKELKDALRSRLFLFLVGGLCAIAVLSLVVASAAFRAKVVDYQSYVAELKQAGIAAVPPPQFFPLQMLRATIEYLEIVGAIVAIVIGYGLAAKEKNRGTLRLIYSRPISGSAVVRGKLLALAVIWVAVIAVLGVVLVASIRIVGGTGLTSLELTKLVITLALSWVYLFIWSALSFGLASRTKQLSTALIAGLVLWLGFVLIIPQIGDTMDPDNHVPGGLFKSFQITSKAEEVAIMGHFSGFETARNLIEETSISKQFERPSFAYLGAKDKYNQKSLGYIWHDMWPKIRWLLLGAGLATALALAQTRKRILGRGLA